jgi:hypothetical protein
VRQESIWDEEAGLWFHPHAVARMVERRIAAAEARLVVEQGESWLQRNGRRFYQLAVGGRWVAVVRDNDERQSVVTVFVLPARRTAPYPER